MKKSIFLGLILCIFALTQPIQASYIEDLPFTEMGKKKAKNKIELAVVAIFRDEARFLKEWIEYYRLQGVERFYLYDNLSQDNPLKVLRPYIDKKIVNYQKWALESHDSGYWNHVQVTSYQQGMAKARADGVRWLIVVDVDEFMVPIQHATLLELVREYNNTNVGMLSGLWLMFGTSNVWEIPKNALMIETLLHNGGLDSRIGEKSILHTQRTNTDGPHYGTCLPGYSWVQLPWGTLQIFHYWSRDQKFLNEVKIPRRIKWGWDPEISEKFMERFNKEEYIDCAEPIFRFIEPLREKMF